MSRILFTSESVSEGHPDKVSDRISDAVLDLYLSKDGNSRVAVETLVTTNLVVLAGETRCSQKVSKDEIEEVVRKAVKEIGYEQEGFNWENLAIINRIHSQSADIALGVDKDGAGDQGIMFGYAKNEKIDDFDTNYMPAAIYISHKILQDLAQARHNGEIKGILPDSKSQVTLEYKDGKAVKANSVLVSTQHEEHLSQADVKNIVRPFVEKNLPDGWMCDDKDLLINPTGRFVIGGPDGDTGLTGRKIIVDTYGGYAPHGGGAFSGKDSTKVDRSAAYISRYMAKNVVAAGLADECTIQLSYAIGVAKPLSLYLNCNGTNKVDEKALALKLDELIDLTPKGIINHLNLNKAIFASTSSYGHFGRDAKENGEFSWEKLDLVEKLQEAFK